MGEQHASYKVGDLISFKLKYMGALGLDPNVSINLARVACELCIAMDRVASWVDAGSHTPLRYAKTKKFG